jgi:crotonobetainyl-CoA:carnitine CoA-transferase CaiB-like acyl-CoA transferase
VHPSFAERVIIQTMQHPNGKLRMPTFPVRFDGAAKPSPVLGETPPKSSGDWLGMSTGV